jgi:predicted PhzF superfamily epimerase YddE/YHI9
MMLRRSPEEAVRATDEITACQSWTNTREDREVVAVRCYTPGGELIQCCGHGLLAAAHAWQRALDRDRLTLEMNGSRIPSWRQDAYTWLRFHTPTTAPCPVPGWVGRVFPAQRGPVAAATSGGERGYLILRWPDDFDLHGLLPRGHLLSGETARALICTAARPSQGEDAIQLRYFAPQYGVIEDGATGSAMRVLAAYWSSRFGRLTARQCSPAGGLLLASLAPGHVDVGGRCLDLDAGAARV